MLSKTIVLPAFLVLTLGGLIATAASQHWWRKEPERVDERPLPTAAEECGKLLKRYRGIDSAVDVGGTIRIYDGEQGDRLVETRTFRCCRYRERYYWQLSYLRTYCDGRYVLQIDTVHRMMSVSKAAKPDAGGRFNGDLPAGILFSDTSAFRMTGSVEAAGAERKLILHSDFHPAVRQYELYYDTASYRLDRAEIEWWKAGHGRVADGAGHRNGPDAIWLGKIDYDPVRRISPDIAAGMAAYITIHDGKAKSNVPYQDYQVNINF